MSKVKILVVDDDPNILQLINLYLTKDGFDTVIVSVSSLNDMFTAIANMLRLIAHMAEVDAK